MERRVTRQTAKNMKTIDQSTFDVDSKSFEKSLKKIETHQQWTIHKLTSSYVPQELIGRVQQKQIVQNFVRECIMNKINCKVLYVSGVPGVGKTASIKQILNKMQKELRKKTDFSYINSLSLKKPSDIYRMIYNFLKSSQNTGSGKSNYCLRIDQILTNLKKNNIIVIDEVDFLLTKDQEILYNLFEWTSQQTTKLGLIIIANTLDFPEKLSSRVNSRMGEHRLIFKPYTQPQIRDVIQDRLKGCGYFDVHAVTFASKKLSTYSSDIRLILSILHQAVVNHKESGKKDKILIEDIAKLWNKRVIRNTSWLQQLPPLYTKIIQYIKNQNGQCLSSNLYSVLAQNNVNQGNMLILLAQLQEMGLLKLKGTVQQGFKCHIIKLLIPE